MEAMFTTRRLSAAQLPPLLREIADPPDALYVRGRLPPSSHTFLTVVGPRRHTTYGKTMCTRLITGLASRPVAIVSGLALGIDAIAHRTALEAGLPTVAVVGSGPDDASLYPRTHVSLAQKILKAGGCIVSEDPPGTPAAKWRFPRRNRIMAGMAHAVLVVEAAEKSGTLITSRLALDYNRDVLAVPGSALSPNSAGTHRLLKEGAALVASVEDLLEALGLPAASSPPKAAAHGALPPEAHTVLAALREPLTPEALAEKTGLAAEILNRQLTLLELAGLIAHHHGTWLRR